MAGPSVEDPSLLDEGHQPSYSDLAADLAALWPNCHIYSPDGKSLLLKVAVKSRPVGVLEPN